MRADSPGSIGTRVGRASGVTNRQSRPDAHLKHPLPIPDMDDVSNRLRRALILFAVAQLVHGSGCASREPRPAAGKSGLVGRLELRPTTGDARAGAAQSAYGDRRLRDADLVDYSRPGFAVVHLALSDPAKWSPGPAETVHITLSDGPARIRIDPSELVVPTGWRLAIRNSSRDRHVVSIPGLGRVVPLEPGDAFEFPVDRSGDLAIHVLDRPGTDARLFSAPGPFVRVPDSGRFLLTDLPPGTHRLHVWHSRMPPLSRLVELSPDETESVDLVLGSLDPYGD